MPKGIRMTVFFKGCPLCCLWSGNPESTSSNPLLSYVPDRCIACGACFPTCKPIGILIRTYMQFWINPSLRFATEFATAAHVWRSVGARLRLGQLHKSLFHKYKPFVNKYLQTIHSYSMYGANSWTTHLSSTFWAAARRLSTSSRRSRQVRPCPSRSWRLDGYPLFHSLCNLCFRVNSFLFCQLL